jgi:hypothetical protein
VIDSLVSDNCKHMLLQVGACIGIAGLAEYSIWVYKWDAERGL